MSDTIVAVTTASRPGAGSARTEVKSEPAADAFAALFAALVAPANRPGGLPLVPGGPPARSAAPGAPIDGLPLTPGEPPAAGPPTTGAPPPIDGLPLTPAPPAAAGRPPSGGLPATPAPPVTPGPGAPTDGLPLAPAGGDPDRPDGLPLVPGEGPTSDAELLPGVLVDGPATDAEGGPGEAGSSAGDAGLDPPAEPPIGRGPERPEHPVDRTPPPEFPVDRTPRPEPQPLERSRPPGDAGTVPGARAGVESGASVPPVVTEPPAAAEHRSGVVTDSPAPARPVPVTQQLVEVVRPLRQRGDGTYDVSLQLEPAELGKVRLEVRLESGTVHVALHAERASTARLLLDQLGDLRAVLEQSGLDAGSLTSGSWDDSASRPHRSVRTNMPEPPQRADEPVPVIRPVRSSGGAVDVLL